MFRKGVIAFMALAVLGGPLLLPGRSQAACAADFCPSYSTNSDGTYVLEIPPGLVGVFKPELADCEWDVEAVFNDGSASEEYTFNAVAGLSASHTFPAYGSYLVQIYATNGMHTESTGSCPPIHIEATVTYHAPAPPPVTPPETKPPAPVVQPTRKSGSGPSAQEGGGSEGGPGGGRSIVYWRRCGNDVYAHGVACKKGRKVVKGALEKLDGRGTTKAAGFTCQLRPASLHPMSCRRGSDRVLGPAAT